MKALIEWYVPVSQAAEMLDCHRLKIYELIDRGALDHIRMPQNRLRVSKTSLVEYLRTVKPFFQIH